MVAAAVLVAGGCASTPGASPRPGAAYSCPAGQNRATTAELVFGRNIGERLGVSDDDWRKFLDDEHQWFRIEEQQFDNYMLSVRKT